MADAPTGTPEPKAPSNDVTPPATPPAANPVDQAEVERLRKENEQRDLRIRQLENEKAAADKAEQERKAKELEDTQQFKTLYETEKAEKERLESEKSAADKKAEVKAEADKLLADYSPEVQKLASDVGLELASDDETAVAAFKARLDALNAPFGGKRVSPNNPPDHKPEKSLPFVNADGVVERPLEDQPEEFDEALRNMPGIAGMMGPIPE